MRSDRPASRADDAVPWGWLIVSTFALVTAAKASSFVTTDLYRFDPMLREKYAAHLPTVLVHGASGILVLAIGPFQFLEPLRRRLPGLHRVAGRIYLAGIVVAGITGLRMGAMAHGGAFSQIAFVVAAALWLVTGWVALRTALRRDFRAHREWMIRNYALTFGAVALRLELDVLQAVGFDFETIYPWMSWAAWTPCVAAGEATILLGRRT